MYRLKILHVSFLEARQIVWPLVGALEEPTKRSFRPDRKPFLLVRRGRVVKFVEFLSAHTLIPSVAFRVLLRHFFFLRHGQSEKPRDRCQKTVLNFFGHGMSHDLQKPLIFACLAKLLCGSFLALGIAGQIPGDVDDGDFNGGSRKCFSNATHLCRGSARHKS